MTNIMKIALTQGKFAIVDDADYNWLNQWKWCVVKYGCSWYAMRVACENGKRTTIFMHREILGLKRDDPREGDHRDGNGLNNRRKNLRIATHTQNSHNRRPQKGGTSQFKGVSWNRQKAKWVACTYVNNHQTYLGLFGSEIEAAQMYDKTAKLFFGEFAHTNF